MVVRFVELEDRWSSDWGGLLHALPEPKPTTCGRGALLKGKIKKFATKDRRLIVWAVQFVRANLTTHVPKDDLRNVLVKMIATPEEEEHVMDWSLEVASLQCELVQAKQTASNRQRLLTKANTKIQSLTRQMSTSVHTKKRLRGDIHELKVAAEDLKAELEQAKRHTTKLSAALEKQKSECSVYAPVTKKMLSDLCSDHRRRRCVAFQTAVNSIVQEYSIDQPVFLSVGGTTRTFTACYESNNGMSCMLQPLEL